MKQFLTNFTLKEWKKIELLENPVEYLEDVYNSYETFYLISAKFHVFCS